MIGWLQQVTGGTLHALTRKLHPPPPMNGQSARMEIVRQIVERGAIERVVETGTHLGSTTLWLSAFGIPVISCELHPRRFGYARHRLRRQGHIQLHQANSVDLLQHLVSAEGLPENPRARPTLFYLDAHWNDYLPLRDELRLVFGGFPRAVVLIDDFQVPGDSGYGYDDYGPGKALTLEYLRSAQTPPLTVFFPSVASRHETGRRRGCVVVTTDAELTRTLEKIPLLRRHAS